MSAGPTGPACGCLALCRSTTPHCRSGQAAHAPGIETGACADAGRAPAAAWRVIRPERAARSSRRCVDCRLVGRGPTARPRPAPPGSPEPGWWGASTSRWRPEAPHRSKRGGRPRGSVPEAPRPVCRAPRTMRPCVSRGYDPSRPGARAAPSWATTRVPCCTPHRAGARRRGGRPSRHAHIRRSARLGRDRGFGP